MVRLDPEVQCELRHKYLDAKRGRTMSGPSIWGVVGLGLGAIWGY